MKSKLLPALLVVLMLAAVVLFVGRDTVRMAYYNLFKTEIQLDPSEEWANGKVYRQIQYADVSYSDNLDLYVPDSVEPVPLLVLVHGGGFLSGDSGSRQCRYMYQYFRDHGYACASVNYRLAEEAAFPGAIEDVKAAIRFLRANAGEYGYDPDKIAVWGESAGGYLAVMAALTGEEDFSDLSFLGEEKLSEAVSSKVSAVVDFYGVSDLEKIDQDFSELGVPKIISSLGESWAWKDMRQTGYESFGEVWLGKQIRHMKEDELKRIRPQWYASKSLDDNPELRVMIWHGDADITVPYLQSERLQETLKDLLKKNQVSYQLFRNYVHADDRFYSENMLEKVKIFLDETFESS